MKRRGISRRQMLKGVGAALALPWMESLVSAATIRKAGKPPKRACFLFMPNGVVPEHWTPKGTSADYELTPMLKPLGGLQSEFSLVENLWHERTDGRNGHWPKVPAWLSGGFVERGSGSDIDTGGTSIDQVLAREIGHKTVLPSLELGTDAPRTGIDNIGGGFPRVVGSYVSWRDPHTPVPKEIVPQLAFDRLFRSAAKFPRVEGLDPDGKLARESLQRDDASILDLVLGDSKSLERRLSGRDRRKLDEYLEALRAVERRVQSASKPQERWVNKGSPGVSRPREGVPGEHAEHVRLMLDILALAFWTDTTRVATFMFGDAQTGRRFDFLPGVERKGFHPLSHHREKREVRDQYEKIGTWHVEQFAYFLRKMKSLDEGEGTLLDNSMVLFGSSLKDGNRHDPHDLPLILAGRGGGTITPGQRYRPAKDTPMCNLLLSMLQAMGCSQESFGDSTGSLEL